MMPLSVVGPAGMVSALGLTVAQALQGHTTVLPFDFSMVNTALLLGVAGYLWRRDKVLDQVKQALNGYGDQPGALKEIQTLRSRVYDLTQAITVLNVSLTALTTQFAVLQRASTERTRSGDP
jgi:hypothetical protein